MNALCRTRWRISRSNRHGPHDAPHRARLRLLQGQSRLRHLLWRVVYRPHLREPHRPQDPRWFWALHAPSKPGSMRISNQVALDEAKAEFEASWKQWKAWAGMRGDERRYTAYCICRGRLLCCRKAPPKAA